MNSYQIGKVAENYAKIFLTLKGMKIITSNYKTKLGEIDIIAMEKNTLVAVEVKKRKDIDILNYAISDKQKNRIKNAFLLFIANNPCYNNHDYRFDALLVSSLIKKPVHIKNAWLVS